MTGRAAARERGPGSGPAAGRRPLAPGLLLGLAALLLAAPASAIYRFDAIQFDPASGIRGSAVAHFDRIPPLGYLPVTLSIRNDTRRTREWTARFHSGTSGDTRHYASSHSLEVGPRSERSVEILVPLEANRGGWNQVELELRGHGVKQAYGNLVSQYSPGSVGTRFTGMSAGLSMFSAVEQAVTERSKKKRRLNGVTLDPDHMPADWRGLVGFDAIWFSLEELEGLSPEEKRALVQWVFQGGELRICHRGSRPVGSLPLPLVGGNASASAHGFGEIQLHAWDGHRMDADEVVVELLGGPNRMKAMQENAPLFSRVAAVDIDRPLMVGFLVCFGIAVGPLNFFVLAPGRRRMRLLLTTPALSVAASLCLLALILFQDGIGGSGERFVLSLLLPEENTEVVFQEQVSRTGVLFRRSFETERDVFVDRFREQDDRQAPRLEGGHGSHDGDWFRPRSVQAQLLQQVRPSRAGIALLNPADLARGFPPVLVSSLSVAAGPLHFRDARGRSWFVSRILPGEQVSAEPRDREHFRRELQQLRAKLPKLSGDLLERAGPRSGSFVAVVEAGHAPLLPTLASIDWEDPVAVMFGVVENAPEVQARGS